jgi:hypothetical protein
VPIAVLSAGEPVKVTVSVWVPDDVYPVADAVMPKVALPVAVFAATVKLKDPVLDPAGIVTLVGWFERVIPLPIAE